MRLFSTLTLLIVTFTTTVAQNESFRSVFGEPSTFGLERVGGIEPLPDGYVVIGSRTERETGEDLLFWRFTQTGALVDSIMMTVPGEQFVNWTYPGPNEGFLMVWRDYAEPEAPIQFTYYESDLTERWNQKLFGLVSPDDIHEVIFKSVDELTLSLSNGPRATALVNFTASAGITDTIYYDTSNDVRLYSVEPAAGDGYLVGGTVQVSLGGGNTFVGLLNRDGSLEWSQTYGFALGEEGNPTQRLRYYFDVHRVPGRNLILAVSASSSGRTVHRLDTLGVRLQEDFIPMAFGDRNENVEWINDRQMYSAQEASPNAYLIQTEDFVPIDSFVFFGPREFGGGNGYLPNEQLFFSTRSIRTSSENLDGFLEIQQLNGHEDYGSRFGRPNRNANEVAHALAVNGDGTFLLMGHMPDTNETSRPTLLYVDRFGNETHRVVLEDLGILSEQVSFTPAADGSVFIMTLNSGSFQLTKVNAEGELLWSKFLPLGNTPIATKIAELSDGNLLVLDSEVDFQTVAGFPIIIRLLDADGNEMSSFKNDTISLRYEQQLLTTPDGLIYLSGSDLLYEMGYLAAYRYGEETPLWTSALSTPGLLQHGASNPTLHPNGSVGVMLYGEFSPDGSNPLLSYVKLNSQGVETNRATLAEGWLPISVSTDSAEDTLTVSFGLTEITGPDSGRHLIRVLDLSYETLEVGRNLSISSPFGFANVAGVENIDDGHTAILVTTMGTDSSFSRDIVLIVLGGDGAITNIRNNDKPRNNLNVYPNPASEELTFGMSNWKVGEIYQYRLISSSGNVISTGRTSNRKTKVALAQIPVGTYFLQLWTSGGKSSFARFIKQ